MEATNTKHPHEARVQRFGYMALAGAVALAALAAIVSPGRLLRLDVPVAVTLGLVLLGAVLGILAVLRRSNPFCAAACLALILGVLPGGYVAPTLFQYAFGLAFGLLLLAFSELVQQTARYDRAHKVVETEGVPEESLDRVTDESLKTLGARGALAVGLAAAGVLIALALGAFGPAPWRAGIETAAPLGVAVASLLLFAILSLSILTRGAKLRGEEDAPEAVAVAQE